MRIRTTTVVYALMLACSSSAVAAGPPPLPKATGGQKVVVVARGVPTPTAFAFLGGETFAAGFGDEEHPKITGGVYVLKGGKPIKIAGSPPHVFGLATSGSTLYVSSGNQILAWSGWDGTRFAKSKVVATGPKRFSGFNGIVVVPGGKLYSGVSLSNGKKSDYAHGTTPFANDIVSVDIKSGGISVVAKGLRQPWQFTYLPGHSGPLVSDLEQENLKKGLPPDHVFEVKEGANYGFPDLPSAAGEVLEVRQAVRAVSRTRLADGPRLAGRKALRRALRRHWQGPRGRLAARDGRKAHPVLTGFVAPVVALGVHAGSVYVGDLTGAVYSVKP